MKPIVLVVEDEFLIARDIKNILQEEGYTVIIDIDDVDQAIAAIELYKPSLVITDINLKKDKDGIDLANYLQLSTEIPYLYLTSSSDMKVMDKVNATRPKGCIMKPFKAIDIKTMVVLALQKFDYQEIETPLKKFGMLYNHLKKVYNSYSSLPSWLCLEGEVAAIGFLGVICEEINAQILLKYNQPVIINITADSDMVNFVVCYAYDEKEGFLIADPRNGFYYTTIEGLNSLWLEKKCLAIVE